MRRWPGTWPRCPEWERALWAQAECWPALPLQRSACHMIYHTYLRYLPKSTNIDRVPQCVSPRQNWDPPPLSRKQVCPPPPPESKGGGGHTRLRVRGWGSPNSDDWRKSWALCLYSVLPFKQSSVILLICLILTSSLKGLGHQMDWAF